MWARIPALPGLSTAGGRTCSWKYAIGRIAPVSSRAGGAHCGSIRSNSPAYPVLSGPTEVSIPSVDRIVLGALGSLTEPISSVVCVAVG
jgi:hypothetical protein